MAAVMKGSIKHDAACSETTPLQSQQLPDRQQVPVLLGLCFLYILCIVPMGLSSALLPSLEGDTILQWSPTTSGLYVGLGGWAVAAGSLSIGWVSDYFPNTLVLLGYIFTAGCILNGMSFVGTTAQFIVLHLSIWFLKSLSWPAAMSTLGTHLKGLSPEVGILMVGLCSRLSNSGSNMLIGELLMFNDWRTALRYIATTLIACAVMVRLVIQFCKMDSLLQPPLRSQPRQQELAQEGQVAEAAVEAGSPSILSGLPTYAAALMKDTTFQLLICFGVGLEVTLSLLIFSGTFVHSIYGEPIAASAILSGALYVGEVLSVLCGLLMILGGLRRKTVLWIILAQICAGVLLAGVLVAVEVPLPAFALLATSFSFATTLGGYLIIPLHCIELAKLGNTGDIALRITIIDGLGTVAGASTRIFVGHQREQDEMSGLTTAAAFAFVGSLAMAVSLTFLLRNPVQGLLHQD